MEHQSYSCIPNVGPNDFARKDVPLSVNCTGTSKIDRSYKTTNKRGRKDFYLQYCVDGGIRVFAEGKVNLLSPGQMIILAPHTPYVCSNTAPEVAYYWVHFTGYDAQSILNRFGFECNKIHNVGSGERIPRLFQTLFREYLLRDRCFDDATSACLISILTEFSRMRDLNEDDSTNTETIFRSLSYFHNHINKPLTVANLAALEHFSPSRYRTVFRRCMGMSPSEYMTRVRMRRACELLAMTTLSVREVGDACGYPDQLYFSRVFRAHFGVPPSKYRGENEFEENDKS